MKRKNFFDFTRKQLVTRKASQTKSQKMNTINYKIQENTIVFIFQFGHCKSNLIRNFYFISQHLIENNNKNSIEFQFGRKSFK